MEQSHAKTSEQVADYFRVDTDRGLSLTQVKEHLAKYGPNGKSDFRVGPDRILIVFSRLDFFRRSSALQNCLRKKVSRRVYFLAVRRTITFAPANPFYLTLITPHRQSAMAAHPRTI